MNSINISSNIDFFAKNENNIVSFARKYRLPLPWWSCITLVDKATNIFSTFILDQPHLKSSIDPEHKPPWNDPTHCYCLADAIMAQNMFKQKYVKDIPSFNQLISSLKDDEPGLFYINKYDTIRNTENFFEPVSGHAMILIKYFEDNSPRYRVVQIFQGKYNLRQFIDKYEKDFYFSNFEDLQTNFLNHLETIFTHKDYWGEEEESAFEKLTKVRLNLAGVPIGEDPDPKTNWYIKRTTNNGSPSRGALIHAATTLMVSLAAASIWVNSKI